MKIPSVRPKNTDRSFMLEAIKEQRKCTLIPKVGAEAVQNDKVIARAHKTENKLRGHAEQQLLNELEKKKVKASECSIFVTMEPCAGTNSCSVSLHKSKVKRVVIGCYDLNSTHYRKGWTYLNSKKVQLEDFDKDLRQRVKRVNQEAESNLKKKTGPIGSGKFPYEYNGNSGVFDLFFNDNDPRKISLKAAPNSANSVHLYCQNGATALALGATNLNQIDDPTALDLREGGWVTVKQKEIAVFCNSDGCALLQATNVNQTDRSFIFKFEIYPSV